MNDRSGTVRLGKNPLPSPCKVHGHAIALCSGLCWDHKTTQGSKSTQAGFQQIQQTQSKTQTGLGLASLRRLGEVRETALRGS